MGTVDDMLTGVGRCPYTLRRSVDLSRMAFIVLWWTRPRGVHYCITSAVLVSARPFIDRGAVGLRSAADRLRSTRVSVLTVTAAVDDRRTDGVCAPCFLRLPSVVHALPSRRCCTPAGDVKHGGARLDARVVVVME